jgi:hypothetical protein
MNEGKRERNERRLCLVNRTLFYPSFFIDLLLFTSLERETERDITETRKRVLIH